MAVDQIEYKLYQYTDDDTRTWTVRCDKTWGDNAESGLGTANDADPRFSYFSRRYHPRYIILSDVTTGRKTRRVCGTNDCTAYSGVNAGGIAHVGDTKFEVSLPIPGSASAVTYKRVKRWGENKPSNDTIRNYPEHA